AGRIRARKLATEHEAGMELSVRTLFEKLTICGFLMRNTIQHKMNYKRILAGLAGCIGLLLTIQGCSTVPVSGRHELNFISPDQELQLGLTSFEQVKKDTPVSQDATGNAEVTRVGRRIAQVCSNDLPNAQWEFVVFNSKEANAFCLPGGKVGVYTGLLPI